MGRGLAWMTPYHGSIKYLYGDAWKKERAEGRYDRNEVPGASNGIHREKPRPDSATPRKRHAGAGQGGQRGRSSHCRLQPARHNRSGYVSIPAGDRRSVRSNRCRRCDPPSRDLRRTPRFRRARRARDGLSHIRAGQGGSESGKLVADEKAATLEGPFFKIAIDSPKGVIRSLVDKRTGRELVDVAAPQGLASSCTNGLTNAT